MLLSGLANSSSIGRSGVAVLHQLMLPSTGVRFAIINHNPSLMGMKKYPSIMRIALISITPTMSSATAYAMNSACEPVIFTSTYFPMNFVTK